VPHTSRSDEPTAAELAAIDREMPLIKAEMTLVEAEARVLTAVPGPTGLDWRRLRRAERGMVVAWLAFRTVDQASTAAAVIAPILKRVA